MNLDDLEQIVKERLKNKEKYPNSYTVKLSGEGPDRIAQKVGEEAVEVVIESVRDDHAGIVMEISDLIYHLTVLLTVKKIGWKKILFELEKRHLNRSQ